VRMEADDLLCSRNARSRTPLARANGTSRRTSGWAGEKVERSGKPISPHPFLCSASKEGTWPLPSLLVSSQWQCHLRHGSAHIYYYADSQRGTALIGRKSSRRHLAKLGFKFGNPALQRAHMLFNLFCRIPWGDVLRAFPIERDNVDEHQPFHARLHL
jgi:hypothetical protein